MEIPETTVECDGCGDELNLLAPHLAVQVKARRLRLVTEGVQMTGDLNEIPDPEMYLGTISGRGRQILVHGAPCLAKYAESRPWTDAKLEVHKEDEIYVPEDNRSPEELVEAGELPRAMLTVYKQLAKDSPGGDE